jgi:hypothetical protein
MSAPSLVEERVVSIALSSPSLPEIVVSPSCPANQSSELACILYSCEIWTGSSEEIKSSVLATNNPIAPLSGFLHRPTQEQNREE